MSMPILEELYYGNIAPCERRPPFTEERQQLNRQISEEKQTLRGQLPEGEGKRLDQLENLYTQYSELENLDAFACGFRLGAKLMGAVMK